LGKGESEESRFNCTEARQANDVSIGSSQDRSGSACKVGEGETGGLTRFLGPVPQSVWNTVVGGFPVLKIGVLELGNFGFLSHSFSRFGEIGEHRLDASDQSLRFRNALHVYADEFSPLHPFASLDKVQESAAAARTLTNQLLYDYLLVVNSVAIQWRFLRVFDREPKHY